MIVTAVTPSPVLDAAQPVLRFAVRENGALEILSPWFPAVNFTTVILAEERSFTIRGDELTITCTNGGATYALSPVDEAGIRAGRLLRAW